MKKWMLISRCGDCQEPIPFNPCTFLGYNPGVDGHLFDSKEEAQRALDLTLEAIIDTGFEVELETCHNVDRLHGPLMEDGSFWHPQSGVMYGGHPNPCLIPERRAHICNDVTIIRDVRSVEVEFFL